MSTVLWPPIAQDGLRKKQESTAKRELEWLVEAVQDTLRSLKAGLEECATLLAPRDSGSTLVLSSQRSESLKGFVTLNGTRIVKGDVQLRLASLPPPRGQPAYRLAVSSSASAPTLVIEQLVSARTLINSCLDVVDATSWTGDASSADYISSQFRLLHENVQEAKSALIGGPDTAKSWPDDPIDKNTFDPPLPGPLSLHFYVADAGLNLVVRTLEIASDGHSGTSTPNSSYSQTYSGLSIRNRLAAALGAVQAPLHDEHDEAFTYRGQQVRVKEKVRVETQDPSLMAALAKLSALEHTVALMRRALDVVMGVEQGEDGEA
ncbi:hypothetical protein K461DRAFT_296586 [Myriangium duriaei CBS 260.36]|uniref:RAVE subunit 2/Rogdi n=1 Tax=Myriangium duriaei CBS 260.36 TaxID=1168546 RepID=A0A9P4IV35_9PEZI|nr:hypothetical protein K461DRAFT_296586 [Myriangium duriaei CBS 260.36]